jgi:hypothetical protein
MENIELPKDVTRFRLRFDFAIEMGYQDHVRTVIAEKAEAERCKRQRKEQLTQEEVEKLAELGGYANRRFFLYFGLIAPKQSAPRPWIWEGSTWFRVAEEAGLYRDMLSRAALSTGRPLDAPPAIYPRPTRSPAQYWTYPGWVVLHDTRQALAAVVPYPIGKSFLKFNE